MSNTAPLVIINESNLNTGIVHKEHAAIFSGYFWHKIFVENATKYSREFVLRCIMRAVHPRDFIPVCYAIEGEYATFMLKNCGQTITKLCALNLTIPYPDEQKNLPPFKMTIQLNVAKAADLKIDIQNNILNVLKGRYNWQKKMLNLEYFINDPDLTEFCPLSQPKLLYFVLYLSRDFDINILKLNGNELETLKSLEAIQSATAGKHLNVIDLRKNNISTEHDLEYLKSFPITELQLSDNPICSNLPEQNYVKLIRNSCPKIQKIDNVELATVGALTIKQNFLCDKLGINFVEQFLEHYFTLYDSPNRDLLVNMYQKNAMFSITSQYVTTGSEAKNFNRFFNYKQFSRNLMTLSDLSKSHEYIFYGTSDIGKMFRMLPDTEHDPCSFTVDLMQFSENGATITIAGVFKEPGQSLLEYDYFYSFTRTFILAAVDNMEFAICNEMLHVTNATPSQQAIAFKVVKIPRSTSITLGEVKTQTEMNEMVTAFVSLTDLDPEWAVKCLQEVNYNFQKALNVFINLFKVDQLPAIAFDFSDVEQQVTDSATSSRQPNFSVQQIAPILPPKPTHAIPAPTIIPSKVPRPIQPPPEKVMTLKKRKNENLKGVEIATPCKQSNPPLVSAKTTDTSNKNNAGPSRVLPTSNSPHIDPNELVDSNTFAGTTTKPVKQITINLQKNKHNMVETSDKVAIDTNIGDLKLFVNDPIILKVLDMTPDTPLKIVKTNLDDACKRVLTDYTYALKYYKAIGRKFYNFQLYSDARTFLTNAMATIPKRMGEQLYCIFTLFEIQYGELNVVENMILNIAESFEVNNAATFLSKDLPRTNVTVARKVFGMIATSDLAKTKKEILLKSYIEFEKEFGNVETLKHARNVYYDCCVPKPVGAPKAQVVEATPAISDNTPQTIVIDDDSVKVETESKETATTNPLPTVLKDNASPAIVEKEQVKVNPAELTFNEFRNRFLIIAGVLPAKENSEDVEKYEKLTEKHVIESEGEVLLKKYPKNFYVVRLVFKAWERCGLTQKIAKFMVDIKKNFGPESATLNPLILYFKAKDDIDNKKFDEAKSKLIKHIYISKPIHIVQVFLDLFIDATTKKEYHEILQETFEICVKKTDIPMAVGKLLILLYVTFAKQCNKQAEKAEALYKTVFHHVSHYFPEDVLENPLIKQQRMKYEKTKIVPRNVDFNYASIKDYVEEVRMHYYLGNTEKARSMLKISAEKFTVQGRYQLKIASAFYEALYGKPCVGLKYMRGVKDINATCVRVLCLYKLKNIQCVRDSLNSICSNILMVINPYSQESVYKYYKAYLSEGLDLFNIIAKQGKKK